MRMHVKRTENTSQGLGLFGVLQIIFLVLKLTGLISWSWVWVLSPLWISIGLVVISMLIILAVAVVQDIKEGR